MRRCLCRPPVAAVAAFPAHLCPTVGDTARGPQSSHKRPPRQPLFKSKSRPGWLPAEVRSAIPVFPLAASPCPAVVDGIASYFIFETFLATCFFPLGRHRSPRSGGRGLPGLQLNASPPGSGPCPPPCIGLSGALCLLACSPGCGPDLVLQHSPHDTCRAWTLVLQATRPLAPAPRFLRIPDA